MASNLYTNCSTISVGCFLYQDTSLTTPVANGFYSDGTSVFRVTGGSGEIVSSTNCTYPCECHDGTITNDGAYSYYDCDGNSVIGSNAQGTSICFNVYRPISANITDNGVSGTCLCTIPPSPTPSVTPSITPSITPSPVPTYSYIIYIDYILNNNSVGKSSSTVICSSPSTVPMQQQVWSDSSIFQNGITLWTDSILSSTLKTSSTNFYFGRLVAPGFRTFKYDSNGTNQVEEYTPC